MKSTDAFTPGKMPHSLKGSCNFFTMRYLLATSVFLTSVIAFTGCASHSKKNMSPPPASRTTSMTLPKPAPMRVATDTNNRRKSPLLPKIVDTTFKEDSGAGAIDELVPPAETKTVSSTEQKFIENEQPEDFFQGVGDTPSGEAVLGGGFFDTVFRPATPPNQPVSSATYTTSQ
jgi:hypothetical protein